MRETSIETYRQILADGTIGRLQRKVYVCLYQHGPMTSNELAGQLRGEDELNLSYHKRLSELERLGLARITSKRPCMITGRTCYEWMTTDLAKPLLRAKKRTTKDINRELSEFILTVAGWLDDRMPRTARRIRRRVDEINEGANGGNEQ